MSDEQVRERWREWARGQGIPAERVEAALTAALEVGGSGTGPHAAAAAARVAAGLGVPADVELLGRELDESRRLADVCAARVRVLAAALARQIEPERPAAPPPAAPPPAAPPPAAVPAPRRPLGPSASEFLSEHSILLLSYTGAFLLVVATVLYELYALTGLNGGLRLAGVLGLDLVFGAAGWACLRSPRLRLVGHTYVAVFAVLAPLVAVAAYVFLGLQAHGISRPLALLLAGSALAALYALLAAGLRSRAYAVLALAAAPVAWLGGLELVPLGTRRAPEVAVLGVVYALVAGGTRRVPWLGPGFRGWVAAFLHGAALLAVGFTLADQVRAAAWQPWDAAATLAVVGAGYLAFLLAGAGAETAVAALAALTLAWTAGAHDLVPGEWWAVAVLPAAAAQAVIGRRGRRVGGAARSLAGPAPAFVHLTALLAAGIALVTWLNDVQRHAGTTWPVAAACAGLAATYLLVRLLSGQPLALLPAAVAGSLAVLAAGAVLHLDLAAAAVTLVALAAAWGVGAELTRHGTLRMALRAGLAVQALVPLLFTSLPARTAAPVVLAAMLLLAAAAWRSRGPWWLVLVSTALAVDWYWWSEVLLPAAPAGVPQLAVAFSPLPAVLGLSALALRALAGRRWAEPAYVLAGLGRELIVYAGIAYAIAAVERSPEAVIGSALAGAVGLVAALAGGGAAHIWYPVALGVLALVVYAAHLAWERARPEWAAGIAAHRFLGLGGTAAAALSGFALPGDTGPGSAGALLATAGLLVLAGLLAFDGRRRRLPLLDYAAVVVASLATFFVARYLDAQNPQWYVAAPGLALVACGLRLPHDARLGETGPRVQAPTAIGAALLLGTTAVQAFTDTGWVYTAVLVVEGVTALVAGIATRSRVLVVAGAAAVGGGGLRALFVLVQQGLLFVAFGAVALLLLALGAALAMLRDRFQRAGGAVAAAWRDWN